MYKDLVDPEFLKKHALESMHNKHLKIGKIGTGSV
jgi:hypothetical protein